MPVLRPGPREVTHLPLIVLFTEEIGQERAVDHDEHGDDDGERERYRLDETPKKSHAAFFPRFHPNETAPGGRRRSGRISHESIVFAGCCQFKGNQGMKRDVFHSNVVTRTASKSSRRRLR